MEGYCFIQPKRLQRYKIRTKKEKEKVTGKRGKKRERVNEKKKEREAEVSLTRRASRRRLTVNMHEPISMLRKDSSWPERIWRSILTNIGIELLDGKERR